MRPITTNWTRIRNVQTRVRVGRINREILRRKLNQATFVSVPLLVTREGQARLPLAFLASLRSSRKK